MSNMQENSSFSTLKMHHIVFDNLSFTRKGFQNRESDDIQFHINASIGERKEDSTYKVTLEVIADKEEEYTASAKISGFFRFESDNLSPDLKENILKKNTVAILFPYIRSQLALLTAQPETTPITIPPMNINALIDAAIDSQP